MNIYSQRLGRNVLNTSTHLEVETPPISKDDAYSQTELSCPPNKNVSMQTKPTLRSSSSQTQATPKKTLQARTTQTEIAPVERTRVSSPSTKSSPARTIQQQPTPPPPPAQKEVVSPPTQPTQQSVRSPPSPEPPTVQVVDEEQQRKNLLLSKLRALDSQKGPPASQPLTTVPVKTTTDEIQSSQPTTSQTTDQKASMKSPPATQTATQEEEAKKKKLLLAKLMAIDDGTDPQKVTVSKLNVTSSPAPQPPRNISVQSSSSQQLWQADTVENLHKGKPAFFTEDDPFGSRNSSGKKSSGTLKAKSGTKTSADDTPNSLGYKPTFGRRARGANTGPSSSIFGGGTKDANPASSKATFNVISESTRNRAPIFSNGLDSDSKANKDTLGLFDSETSNKPAGRDYPWEKRVNLHDSNPLQGPGNQSMVFGPMAKAPLLPLRPKAEANRVDMLPGGLAEPDDLEELVL